MATIAVCACDAGTQPGQVRAPEQRVIEARDDAASVPTCQPRDQIVMATETVGTTAVACFGPRGHDAADPITCWAIDASGDIVPITMPPSAADDEGPTVLAPAGWTAHPLEGEIAGLQGVVGVAVCDATHACHDLRFAPSAKYTDLDESIATIAVAPDGTSVYVDRGMHDMSASRIEQFAWPSGKRRGVLAVPRHACSNIVQFLGPDRLLLQGFDCANFGGWLGVLTLDGRSITTIKGHGDDGIPFDQAVVDLGDHRWAFDDLGYVLVYDVETGKRLAAKQLANDDDQAIIGGAPGMLVAVASDGTVRRFDATLAVTSTTTIPMCP